MKLKQERRISEMSENRREKKDEPKGIVRNEKKCIKRGKNNNQGEGE